MPPGYGQLPHLCPQPLSCRPISRFIVASQSHALDLQVCRSRHHAALRRRARASAPLLPKFLNELAAGAVGTSKRTSAADLKFLHHLPHARSRNFRSKSGTRIICLLVPLCFRSSCQTVPRCITNFGNGALVRGLALSPCPPPGAPHLLPAIFCTTIVAMPRSPNTRKRCDSE